MTLTAISSYPGPSLPAVTHADELNRQSPQAAALDQAAVAKLLLGVEEAALNPAALQKLAYTIAGNEGIPAETQQAHLVALLGSAAAQATPATIADALSESEDERREAEEQESRDISELRKQAEATQARLRRALVTMENLRASLRADTPHARQCARFADAWRTAIDVMDDLLQPSLEARLAQRPREIADTLTSLSADLAFKITTLDESEHIPGSMRLA